MKSILCISLFCLTFIMPLHAQKEQEVLSIFYTVGVVDVEINADFDERSQVQIEAVADKAHKIAKKLNKLVKRDKVVNRVSLSEWGRDGVPVLAPRYDVDGSDPTKMISLAIALPDSLFEEDIIIKLYKYGITIPKEVEWSHADYHMGKALLERVGIIFP